MASKTNPFQNENLWPIERLWKVYTHKELPNDVPSTELIGNRACCLLGTAGQGKTTELSTMASLERQAGRHVRFDRLNELAQSSEVLTAKLTEIADGLQADDSLYLDALDELMVPVRTSSSVISNWIKDCLAEKQIYLRISCRSAIWPRNIENALKEVYGDEHLIVATLQELTEEDIRMAAKAQSIDQDAFLMAVDKSQTRVLASQPLTLRMLFKVIMQNGTLPKRRNELFKQGLEILADERSERREVGTNINLSLRELLDIAERLAAYLLLSGRDIVDISDNEDEPTLLSRRELQQIDDGCRPFDDQCLDALRNCGLVQRVQASQFRFAHRQFAEYLAGRRLSRMKAHQSKSLLAVNLGWEHGVAGPLRETAAFAAAENDELASWIADKDPELIGNSDVADHALRRKATISLIDRFRRHELTDHLLDLTQSPSLSGFRYADPEDDLRKVLGEMGKGTDDAKEFVIRLIESWRLTSLSSELATLMLDTESPLAVRRSAGYALHSVGDEESKARLLPLITTISTDENLDLKGLALRCNWPARISVPKLLEVLTPPSSSNYHGAYSSFLFSLIPDFSADGHRAAGLKWACQFLGDKFRFSLATDIVRQIAHSAINDLHDPIIARELVNALIRAADSHVPSPLGKGDHSAVTLEPVLEKREDVRRALLNAIAEHQISGPTLWQVCRETPGLLCEADTEWMIYRSLDNSFTIDKRVNFARIARLLPWDSRSTTVDLILAARDVEPIKTEFPFPMSVDLESKDIKQQRELFKKCRQGQRPKKTIQINPTKRVLQALENSEQRDYQFFRNLCSELTLEEKSEHYGFNRVLTTTPGWAEADERTRLRIAQSAKRYVEGEIHKFDHCRSKPLNTIHLFDMAAILLLFEVDPAYLHALPRSWWENWCWHILREVKFRMSGEPDSVKKSLLNKLVEHAPASVENEIIQLSQSVDEGSDQLLSNILEHIESDKLRGLTSELSKLVSRGAISIGKLYSVAAFVIRQDYGCSEQLWSSRVVPFSNAAQDAVQVILAMLKADFRKSWSKVYPFMKSRGDLAPSILSGLALWREYQTNDSEGLTQLTSDEYFELISLLFEHFPPGMDPKYEGAHSYTNDDYARDLRGSLVTALGNRHDAVAVDALRKLESKFRETCPWLRRPRAQAERAFRWHSWESFRPSELASLLKSQKNRLIRSPSDAMDGVLEALRTLSSSLQSSQLNDLEDFWNRQHKNELPFPKEEERVSDKLCGAICQYFEEYAVVTNREVQLFKRKLSRKHEGAPGSEADLLLTVPGNGSLYKDKITIVIEVKLSCNREALTSLKSQLVDRYMKQCDAQGGVFCVAWMGRNVPRQYRPVWKSIDQAEGDLRNQATVLSSKSSDIRSLVIDLSLPISERVTNKCRSLKRRPKPKEKPK